MFRGKDVQEIEELQRQGLSQQAGLMVTGGAPRVTVTACHTPSSGPRVDCPTTLVVGTRTAANNEEIRNSEVRKCCKLEIPDVRNGRPRDHATAVSPKSLATNAT